MVLMVVQLMNLILARIVIRFILLVSCVIAIASAPLSSGIDTARCPDDRVRIGGPRMSLVYRERWEGAVP